MSSKYVDLSERSDRNNQYVFTDFLSLSEQDDFFSEARGFAAVPYELFGGHPDCERKMARFGSEEYFGYEIPYPIECLLIEPTSKKFAGAVTHRDFLGALMNLGLERKVMGDIVVDDRSAYLFCLESVSDYIMANLDRVGHNPVKISRCEVPKELFESHRKTETIQAASMRIDAVVAKAYNLSRSEVLPYFFEKKVAVDGRIVENNDRQLAEGETISVRGFGKFTVDKNAGLSRKGRQNIVISKYV